jgi:hypothetical protein
MFWMLEQRVIEPWVRDLTEEVFGMAPFNVGDIVEHPSDRRVQIVDGQYWAEGGFSNHWYWREVLADGSLSETIENGYGWRSPWASPYYPIMLKG